MERLASELVDSRIERYIRAMTHLQHRAKRLASRSIPRSLGIVVLAGIALASCSSRSEPNGQAAQGSGGGSASAIKACDLLTQEEIKQATGASMGPGKLQTTNTQASCDWSNDETTGA